MTSTKKVGSSGRFGAKYGRKIRLRVKSIDATSKAWHDCPSCKAPRVHRQSSGIWACQRCGVVFAGGAYAPTLPESKTPRTEPVVETPELEVSV